MIKAVIFDVGGVLHIPLSKDITRNICETLGITEDQYSSACKAIINKYNTGKIIEESKFWTKFITLVKSSASVPNYSLWNREFARKYRIQSDVMEIVSKIKDLGLKVAVLSNTIAPHAQVNREKGVYAPFDTVILSYEVGLRKPDSAIYQLTLDQLKVEASDSAFIDDDPINVQTAEMLGIHGIVYKNAPQLLLDLSKIGIVFRN